MLPDLERADRIGEFWRLHRTGVGQCADSLGRPISIRSWLDPPFLGKSGPREPRCGSPLRGFPHLSTDPRASISQWHAASARSSSTPSTPSPSGRQGRRARRRSEGCWWRRSSGNRPREDAPARAPQGEGRPRARARDLVAQLLEVRPGCALGERPRRLTRPLGTSGARAARRTSRLGTGRRCATGFDNVPGSALLLRARPPIRSTLPSLS
jgi:hypothetical protein